MPVLLYLSVIRLKGLHTDVSVVLHSPYAVSACLGSRHSGDVGNTVPDSLLADIAVIICAGLACGGVDDKLYLAVCDLVCNVGTALVDLEYTLCRDSCVNNHLVALARCKNFEAQLIEILCYLNKLGLVSVTYAEKNGAFLGKSCLSSLLSLVIRLAEGR